MSEGIAVFLSPMAKHDLQSAIAYGREHFGSERARQWVQRFRSLCDDLSHYPDMGVRRYILPSFPGLRHLLMDGDYLVFYIRETEGAEDRVRIVRVLHGTRDIAASLTGDQD